MYYVLLTTSAAPNLLAKRSEHAEKVSAETTAAVYSEIFIYLFIFQFYYDIIDI